MSGPAAHVVVVGDVGLDVITRPSGAINWGTDTRSTVSVTPGGAGANTASWLVAEGVSTTLLARVGDDPAADAARRELEGDGIRCLLTRDDELATCTVVVLLDEHGERTMFPDRGANRAFSAADVAAADLGHLVPRGERGHLHLSAYVLFDAGSREGGLAALAEARRLGWSTSVDPQAPSLIEREGVQTVLDWVDGVDLLLPNAAELAALGGEHAVLERVMAVACTHGAEGARWVDGTREISVPAVPCAGPVDATGCGDAFNAGFLGAWLAGQDPQAALTAGVRAGSRAAALTGARPRPGERPGSADEVATR